MAKSFIFNTFSENIENSLSNGINECNQLNKKPVFVCIGSDLILGDSLGPLVGTMLRNKNLSNYIYGTLNYPITAREVEYVKKYLKEMHPNSIIIAIDAAIGCQEDVGLIKVCDKGLMPGLGVDKKLGVVGEMSIVGIVASKSLQNYNLYNLTRLNLVYKMATKIADGIEQYINSKENQIFGSAIS